MELYLLRHGIAEENSATGRDYDRRLTDDGERKLRKVLSAAAAAGVAPAVILSSPYVRAQQTAEIAKEVLGTKEEIQLSNSLVPESDPEEVWREIRHTHGWANSVLVSSHEPLMGRCAGFFLGYPDLLIDFKKGAILFIEIQQSGMRPRGVLRWMVLPKLAGA